MDRGGMRIARSTRACRLVVIADRMNNAEVVRRGNDGGRGVAR